MNRGKVAIYTGSAPAEWSPRDVEDHGLGGAKTAVVEVASALSGLGHRVIVYGAVAAGDHDGVAYRPYGDFDLDVQRAGVISSRVPELFDRRGGAKVNLLWMYDADGGARLTAQRARNVDWILAVSNWHVTRLRERHPFAAGRVVRTRSGVDLSRFPDPPPPEEREPRVLCTSQPERGLDVLLELWPAVRERVPEAELAFCYAPVYDQIVGRYPKVASHRERIAALEIQPGVRRLGPLPQPALARLMLRSRVWAHPSWATPDRAPFFETSCISALEAQAAGLWCVASAWGALPETVRVGALVEATDAPGECWRKAFVEEIVRGLVDPQVRARAATEGPLGVADLGWEGVAESIAGLIGSPAPG